MGDSVTLAVVRPAREFVVPALIAEAGPAAAQRGL
jgi:hypothetical protein